MLRLVRLCNPHGPRPVPLSLGFFQARILESVASFFSRISSEARNPTPGSPVTPALEIPEKNSGFFTTKPPGKSARSEVPESSCQILLPVCSLLRAQLHSRSWKVGKRSFTCSSPSLNFPPNHLCSPALLPRKNCLPQNRSLMPNSLGIAAQDG